MKLRVVKGDLFAGIHKPVPEGVVPIYVHCIAEDGKWGAGIAPKFMEAFDCASQTYLDLELRRDFTKNRKMFAPWCVWQTKPPFGVLAHLVTKQYTRGKPTLETLGEALRILRWHMFQTISSDTVKLLKMPKIGCGLDRLNWQDVERLLWRSFDYDNIEIKVYEL